MEIRCYQNTTRIRIRKAKISKSTSVQWYGNMQLVKNKMNRKPRPCDSRAQPRVNNAHSEQYCDSIDSICHKNLKFCLWRTVFLINVTPVLL